MTTKNSPLHELQAQATRIAASLKAAGQQGGKETLTFGVFMDDKVLKITMAWDLIRKTSEAGLAAYILKQMREAGDN